MRDRLRGVEVLENFGIPKAEAEACSEQSEFLALFRKLLFSRLVPCVKDIGLWANASSRPTSTWASWNWATPISAC
ncbi:hypothetical protein GCM10010304_26100 [Streptomyces roseoviolaceus]